MEGRNGMVQLEPQIPIKSKKRRRRQCGYPHCEFTALLISGVEAHYISKHTPEYPFICTYDVPRLDGEGSTQCGSDYSAYAHLLKHRRTTGHGAKDSAGVYTNVMAAMRKRYPNMVLGPQRRRWHVYVPSGPGAPRSQAPQRSGFDPAPHPGATVAPASAPVSPSHPYPVSWPTQATHAPTSPCLAMNVDDGAYAGSAQEDRPTLVPLAELERARYERYGTDLPAHDARSAWNALPSPYLHLPPLLESSLAGGKLPPLRSYAVLPSPTPLAPTRHAHSK
ncbi:uncharacterized protein TRAVEDRAFT_53882 [Trametes versicolor FP-101664 SS1]|uniref:uncharacterized protein n=1 Tax=Trametes versicolor (strain FP-101664) TaxID=717944 RepID=UPI000462143B|nr:uncharacterized protein TRAVEDRAFT_53882 [Trametes versicolor FP-101664 SS1]EIW52461.1 hypothetical protein TRAVEDRAFT_53882 [Trametes versicolor FP-101664 SS1]